MQLPDVRVGLRVRYLVTIDRWALWLLALDSSVLFGPVLLVGGDDLLYGRRHDPRVPQGELFVTGGPATLANADVSAFLVYRAPGG